MYDKVKANLSMCCIISVHFILRKPYVKNWYFGHY